MSDQHKLAILIAISDGATAGKPERYSFNALGKTVGLAKQVMDELLVQLNKDKFISQYAKKGVDSFTVVVNQKGFDAVLDGSFI